MKDIRLLIYFVFVLYFLGVFQLYNIGTFGIQPSYPVVLIIYILLFFKFITNNIELNTNPINSTKLLLLLQIASGVSFLFVITNNVADEVQFLKSYGHFLYLTMFSLAMGLFNHSNDTWLNVIKIWLIISIILNLFGIYQLFARAFELPLAWIELTNASLSQSETETYQQLSLKFSNFYRATSIFSEPSALAGFNLTIIGFLIFPIFKSESYRVFKSNTFLNFIFILSAITLFVTFSLTAVLGLFFLFAAYLVYNKGLNIKKILKIAISIIVLIVISDILIESVFETSLIDLFSKRISNILGISNEGIVGESFGTRADNFNESLRIWMESPIIGVGLGQMRYFGTIGFSDYGIMHALAESGLLGGMIFTLIFIFVFIDLFMLRKSFSLLDEKSIFLINSCYYSLMILFMTNFLTSNSYIVIGLWLIIGFYISVITNAKKQLGYDLKPILFFKKKPHQAMTGHK